MTATKTKKRTMSLRDVRRTSDLVRLGRDNLDAGDFWILVGEYEVTIAEQKTGEREKAMISIPKRHFDRIVDLYQRKQVIR